MTRSSIRMRGYLGDALPSQQELDRLPDAVDGSCPLDIPVDGVMNATVFRVAVHRKKDPDYRALGFEPLAGVLQPRPGDERFDSLLCSYTHWGRAREHYGVVRGLPLTTHARPAAGASWRRAVQPATSPNRCRLRRP